MLKSKIHCVLVPAVLLGVSLTVFGQTIPAASEALEKKLIGVLQSEASHQEKAAACRQLSVIGTTKSIGALAALLADEKLSHMARYALEPIPDTGVDEAFRECLGTLKGKPLVGVIGSVGVRGDTKAVGTLAKMLNDRDGEVAQAAARSLGNIGKAAASAALQGALAKASGDRQLAICEGLFRCAERFVEQGRNDAAIAIYDNIMKLKAPHQVRAGALRGAILARQGGGMGLLAKYLNDADYILFSAAVQTAQESKVSQATEVLLAALNSQSTDRKVLLIQALGTRGDRKALPTLYGLLSQGDKPVRLTAIRVLPQIKGSSGLVLVKLLDDRDKEISSAAVDSFAAIDDAQCDAAVLEMLKSRDTNKRLLAIDLIGRRWMRSAMRALLQAASGNDGQVRVAAVKKVGEMGGSSEAEALLDLLGRPQWATQIGTDLISRWNRQDEIDEALRGIFAEHDRDACVEELIAAGVPAARVVDPRALCEHPQFIARGFLEEVEHPIVEQQMTMGAPFRFASVENWLRHPAPTLGQHNTEILHELGYDEREINALVAEKVIGNWPEGV